MTGLEQLLASWLLNAIWLPLVLFLLPVGIVKLFPGLPVRLQHRLWLGATVLSSLLPFGTILGLWGSPRATSIEPHVPSLPSWFIRIVLVIVFVAIGIRVVKLIQEAWCAHKLRHAGRAIEIPPAGYTPLGTNAKNHVPDFQIRVSPRLASSLGPVTLGIIRPVVLVPESFFLPENSRMLRAALIHEIAHIERWDMLTLLLSEIALATLAFHPATKWFRRHLTATREMACDQLVTERFIPSIEYADALLDVARTIVHGAPALHVLGIADGPILDKRIRALVDSQSTPIFEVRVWQKVGFFAVAAFIVIFLGCSARSLFMWLNPLPVVRVVLEHVPSPPPPPTIR